MKDLSLYPFEVRHLSEDEGGGYLVSYPDFSECLSDGDTLEEALTNAQNALSETVAALESMGLAVPQPGSGGYSGRFVQRLPKSLHARLVSRAKAEGVSLNTLVATFVAEGLGRRPSA